MGRASFSFQRISKVAFAAAALALPGRSTAQAEPGPPEIRTVATATRSVRPDLASLTLRFGADGVTPAEAGRNLALRTDSLRRALAAAGIPGDSVVNGSRWYWWQGRLQPRVSQRCVMRADGRGCDQVTDTAWRALETLTIRIRQLERVGAVIDTALAYRITEIQGPEFTATDLRAVQDEALRAATEGARRQAVAIAEAGGGRLGRILSLSTVTDRGDYIDPRERLALQLSSGAASIDRGGTIIVAPSVALSVSVYGRWELVER
jgi:hypothetical protein